MNFRKQAAWVLVALMPIVGLEASSSPRLTKALEKVSPPEKVVEKPKPKEIVKKIDPKVEALLDTLSRAEGTFAWQTGKRRYDVRYAFRKLDTSAPHPRTVIYAGYASDASGAYQFLSPTWISLFGYNAIMSPENQDKGALKLVKQTGYDFNKPFVTQAPKLAPVWASFPWWDGWSFYGQSSHSLSTLNKFYLQRLVVHSALA